MVVESRFGRPQPYFPSLGGMIRLGLANMRMRTYEARLREAHLAGHLSGNG